MMTRFALVQMIGIVLVSSGLGLGVNAIRSSNGVKLTRNYFRALDVRPASSSADATSSNSADGETGHGDGGVSSQHDMVGDSSAESSAGDSKPAGLEHNFIAVTLDEVVDLYLSEDFGFGLVLFVDARNAKQFEESHIPGAVLIDRYNSDQYVPEARVKLDNANTIVVYCGGGECEDSIFLATELVELWGIPYDKIRLFEGGMMAWEGDGLEIEGSRAP